MATTPDLVRAWLRYGEEIRREGLGWRSIKRRFGLSSRQSRTLSEWRRYPERAERFREQYPNVWMEGAGDVAVEVVQTPDGDDSRGVVVDRNDEERLYVFQIPGVARPVRLSFDDVQQMRRDYSAGSTINQVARTNSLTRREFMGIKRGLGWTKDDPPLTRAEMEGMEEDEIVEVWLAEKVRAAEVKVRDKHWRQTREDAARWRHLDRSVLARMESAASRLADTYEPPRNLVRVPSRRSRRWMLALCPTDLHYGKGSWSGFGPGAYDRETCRARLLASIEDLLACLPCTPEEILVPIGSDWFHVDNAHGATTKGTPQDMDGVPEQIWEEGQALALDMLEAVRQVAPLRLVLQAGNHDEILSLALFSVVRAWFRNDPDVRIEEGSGPYNFVEYGASLLGVHHGHGQHKAKDLGPLMATHQRKAWGRAEHRYWLTGNLHHYSAHEDAGVEVLLFPSLSGSDRWHTLKGYTMSRPQLMGVGLDYERGKFAQWFAPVGEREEAA